ncbi:MAG: DUF1846 family protein, partial [Clostridia bacterium]|nr:DUF1846 family protein [Clostridia bacterium]
RVLTSFKDDLEIIICVSAKDIVTNKIRADFDITYDKEVFRLIENLTHIGLTINSVVVTMYENAPGVNNFIKEVEFNNIKVYKHYAIDGYPDNVELILSDKGYGRNEYIPTSKPLVVVCAPGPGSGKLATCLNQLYHEYKSGVKAGYAKFETFPVWNVSIASPINISYEAATADLHDKNEIDYFHKAAYGITSVNYNRDLEAFPVLKNIINSIMGEEVYQSPTDMGINVIGDCISDIKVCEEAAKQEIIRRYLKTKLEYKRGHTSLSVVESTHSVMSSIKLTTRNRKVLVEAEKMSKQLGCDIVAIELHDGKIIFGKEKDVFSASASCLLNAITYLAQFKEDALIIKPEDLEPIVRYKKELFGEDSRLELSDVFVAMSTLSETDTEIKLILEQVSKIKDCEVHSTTLLSKADEDFFRVLSARLTMMVD